MTDKPKQLGAFKINYRGHHYAIASITMQVGGGTVDFETVVRSPGVRVIAIQPAGQLVYLTRQRRAEANRWDWQVPGAKVFEDLDSYLPYFLGERRDEDRALMTHVKDAAIRACDEVRIELTDLEVIGKSACGATINWDVYFAVRKVGDRRPYGPEPGEEVEVHPMPWSRALELIDEGEVREERAAIWLRQTLLNLTRESRQSP